jgi:hypothetical protein
MTIKISRPGSERGSAGLGDGLVLLARAATHPDSAHDSAIALQGDASAKIMIFPLLEA